MPWYLGNSGAVFHVSWIGYLILFVMWSAFWTGLALWHAAKRGERAWFIVFLIVHTAGILEILYLVFVVKVFTTKQPKEKIRTCLP